MRANVGALMVASVVMGAAMRQAAEFEQMEAGLPEPVRARARELYRVSTLSYRQALDEAVAGR
jgi:hypothetical protein